MNAPFEPVHSPFGGSVAARNLGCPANVKLIEQVPESLRRSSSYATIRGTALHIGMARLIERECSLNDLVGETIGDYTITSDDVENALRPVLGYVEALLDQPGAEYFLERRIVFPGIANTFGTADLIIRIGDTIYVIDFKFGSGVRVLAIYPDGDEDVLNAQLLFYAAAARYSLPEFFAGVDNIILSILQPQSIEVDAELESWLRSPPKSLTPSLRPIAWSARKHFRLRRAWSGGPGAASARRSRFVRSTPSRCLTWRNSSCRRLLRCLRRKPICSCSQPA